MADDPRLRQGIRQITDYVKLNECVPRRLYQLRSRNLSLGVYDGQEGFLGLRTKWGHRYVFCEYHWDQGPPVGTVKPLIDLGVDLPDNIPLVAALPGSWNQEGDREVEWRPDEPEGKIGKHFFKDTGEHAVDGGFVKPNRALFAWLEAREGS